MKFHSPYHFIPVQTDKTATTDWSADSPLKRADNHYLRHDYWHPEGESGRITCRITCRSPLVVGGKQSPGDQATPGTVAAYVHPHGGPAIPGNSLRGMISSLAEAISQSALRVLTAEKESVYSVRKPVESAQKMQLGLLYKKGDDYHIIPLDKLDKRESVGDYRHKGHPDTRFIKSQQSYQHRQNRRFVSRDPQGGFVAHDQPCENSGILYIRVSDPDKEPRMPRKYHETLIPWDTAFEQEIVDKITHGKGFKVAPAVIQTTENILKMRYKADEQFFQLPKGYQRQWDEKEAAIIHDGDLIYYREENGHITELSYSVIWRSPVKGGSPHQAFARHCGENSLPWNKDRRALTPAEALFGVVEDEPATDVAARNIASRIRFSDAVSDQPIEAGSSVILKILASPKPPSPAMYFNSATGYVAKTDLDMNKHVPNGRKQYLPHPQQKNIWQTDSKEGDCNWKLHLKCTPIPEGSRFEFQIDYENLSKAELGLLRTALEPGAGFVHRLGLGKPLGLGHVDLNIKKIERIDRAQRYRSSLLTTARYQSIKEEAINSELIDAPALEILCTLGDPKYIKHPVSYPFMEENTCPEKKGYVWFMENEKKQVKSQYLEPVEPGKTLPVLDSRHTHKK